MKVTDEMLDAITDCARRWDWESMSRASARERIREDLSHVFAAVPELTANECAACIAALVAIETPDTEQAVARLIEKLTKMAQLNPREVSP